MRKYGKTIASASIVTAAFGFFLYKLYKEWDNVANIDWRAHPWFFAIHIITIAFMYLFFLLAWHSSLKTVNYHLSFRSSSHIWLLPNLGKYVPGKILMLAGRIELLHKTGLRRASCMESILIEHIMQVFSAVPFLALAIISGAKLELNTLLTVVIIVTCICLTIILWPKLLPYGLNLIMRLIKKEPMSSKFKRSSFFASFLYFVAGWILYGLSGIILVYALGFEKNIPLLLTATAFVSAWLIGFMSLITPGGIGVREAVLVALLSPYISTSHAVTLALISRLTWIAMELLGVVIGASLDKNLTLPTLKNNTDLHNKGKTND